MLKTFFIALALVLAGDFVWLGFVMRDFNLRQLAPIARIENGSFHLMIWPAIVAYILMAGSLTLFSVPRAMGASSSFEVFAWGAALGLFIYGIYDMTNLAILKDYPLAFALSDMAWGTFLYGLVTWIIVWQKSKI